MTASTRRSTSDPVINETQLRRIHSYTDIGRGEGASLLLGGEIATEGALAKGWFYRPTVFGDVQPTMRIAQEEIFGPTTVIMPVASIEEAIAAANSTQYGLSLSVYTNDLRTAFHAIHELHSGIVYINAPTIGAEIQLPFGGTRNTGQRPPRGRRSRARRVQRMEVHLHRLQRTPAARSDRHRVTAAVNGLEERFTTARRQARCAT